MEQPTPPKLAQAVFDWFCDNAMVEDLKGDLDEMFVFNVSRMSPTKARWIYWRQVIALIFSYAVKRRKQNQAASNTITLPDFSMLHNYFVSATRNLAKQRFFTIINVVGLATGMSVSLLVLALLSFLQTYDDFQVNRDRVYRVTTHVNSNEYNDDFASCPSALYEKLSGFKGIEKMVRISSGFYGEVSYDNRELLPLQGYFADDDFLSVFSFPLIQGNSSTALSQPNGLVITQAAALRIFGTEDAIGKTLHMPDKGLFEITGILKDLPKNTHFTFEALASYQFLDNIAGSAGPQDSWTKFFGSYLYILFEVGGDPTDDIQRTEQAFARIAADQYSRYPGFKADFSLQPLNNIIGPERSNEIGRDWGGYAGRTLLFLLTLFILVPACFNYANISISRALKRSREIGLRKVMGGQRSQIFTQFVLETVIITLIALIGGMAIFVAVRNQFITILADGSGLELTLTVRMVIYFFVFALAVGLLAGIVPAVYFSRLNPIDSLRGSSHGKAEAGFSMRKILITSQFALSMGFIMCVVVTWRQHRASINYDFGFNHKNVLAVDIRGVDPQLFRNEFSKFAEVRSMTCASHTPGTTGADLAFVVDTSTGDSTEVFRMFADHGQIETFGLSLLAGSNFVDDYGKCGNGIVVNESFVNQFKMFRPIDAVGRVVTLAGGQEVRIAGVMKDFHYTHLEQPIKSFFYQCDPTKFKQGFLAIQSNDLFTTLSAMEKAWKVVGGERKFSPRFVDEQIEEAYEFHLLLVKTCSFLGLLAISISCLGMLGMVVFTVENRVKEVGVRKVMGASVSQIVFILSKDFVSLMLIASAIAIPLTWLFFEKLYSRIQNYSLPIGAFEIMTSLFILFVLGLSTIFSQTLKAAAANPVASLRHE